MTHQLVTAVVRVIGDVEVESAYGGEEALRKAEAAAPDLIISDINMPDMDGLMLTRRLREHPRLAGVPILLLTARGEAHDKYEGFLQGADDYMVKPFDVIELQLRIKALLRRAPALAATATPSPLLQVGTLTFHPERFTIEVGEAPIRFTASEFALLRVLGEHAGQIIAVETLLRQALDYPAGVGNPQTIHSHIRNLRAKFRKAGVDPVFLTSSWQGYMLDPDATA